MALWLYVARRLAVLVPTLFFVSVLIFSLQALLPGDAAVALAGEEQDPAVVAAIRARYHLDRPVPVRYGLWLGRVLQGDFGESLRSRIPVRELLASKLPVTVELAACSMLVALLIGLPAAVAYEVNNGQSGDAHVLWSAFGAGMMAAMLALAAGGIYGVAVMLLRRFRT